MSGVIPRNLKKKRRFDLNRFLEVHKRGTHSHTHRNTQTHDDSIKRNAILSISPKNVKMTFVDVYIFHRMTSLRKLYSLTFTYFSKVKDSIRNLLTVTTPQVYCCTFHSGDRPYRCDECEYYCTQSSALARYKLKNSSIRLFKCDECKFKCDEGDSYSKSNRKLTRHKRARHPKGFLPDSVPFVQVLHSITLPLRKLLRCLPSNFLDPLLWSRSIGIRL